MARAHLGAASRRAVHPSTRKAGRPSTRQSGQYPYPQGGGYPYPPTGPGATRGDPAYPPQQYPRPGQQFPPGWPGGPYPPGPPPPGPRRSKMPWIILAGDRGAWASSRW